ncbi:MAG: hypothetical protein KDD62_11860, partial [Bdellovibrionales bacterium]|nr:hypothetical protein [Bdellovibrionales bacterium]
MDAGDRALLALKEQMTEEQRQDMADLLRAELERREKEKRMGSMDTLTPSKPKSKVKSSAFSDKLGPNEVGEIYGELNDQVKSLRLKQLERRLAEAKADQKRMGVHVAKRERSLNKIRGVFSSKKLPMLASMPPEVEQVVREAGVRLPSGSGRASGRIGSKNAALLLGLLALGGLKILASTGVVDATKSDTSEQPMIERAALSHTAEFPDTVAPALPSEGSSATEVVEISAEQRKLVGWSFADKQLLSQLD